MRQISWAKWIPYFERSTDTSNPSHLSLSRSYRVRNTLRIPILCQAVQQLGTNSVHQPNDPSLWLALSLNTPYCVWYTSPPAIPTKVPEKLGSWPSKRDLRQRVLSFTQDSAVHHYEHPNIQILIQISTICAYFASRLKTGVSVYSISPIRTRRRPPTSSSISCRRLTCVDSLASTARLIST